jgi:hypothetical protein
MPISIRDGKQKINNWFESNFLMQNIFNNILIVSTLIVIINILIINYNLHYDNFNIIKVFIWSLLSTVTIIILNNKAIKIYYQTQNKKEGTEEFKNMMENNTTNLIKKNIDGQNEVESDIIKFLDRSIE